MASGKRNSPSKDTLSPILGSTMIYFSLFKGMVGIAFLYLPIGFSHAGWAFSLIAFLICTILSSEGFNRLIIVHEKVGGNYSELANKAGGQIFEIILECFLVLSQVFSYNTLVVIRYRIYSVHNNKPV